MRMKMSTPYKYVAHRNPRIIKPRGDEQCDWLLIDGMGHCQEPVCIQADIRKVDGGIVIVATLCTEHFIEVVRNYRKEETWKWEHGVRDR